MGNAEYMYAFQKVIMPIAWEFDPDLVISKNPLTQSGRASTDLGQFLLGSMPPKETRLVVVMLPLAVTLR